MTAPAAPSLACRLERLERRERVWRSVALGLVLGLALGLPLLAFAPAAHRAVADEVRARSFLLVDDQDQVRARLGFSSDREPRFELLGREGKPRLLLRVRQGETFVNLCDPEGRMRLGLTVDGSTSPQVLLYDSQQRMRGQLAAKEHGACGIMFAHEDGVISAGQGVDATGSPWRIDKPLRGGDMTAPESRPTR